MYNDTCYDTVVNKTHIIYGNQPEEYTPDGKQY